MISQPLSIAFVWHMHQPYYRNAVTGECSMPWVRLHATKDYLDMVQRLEAFPTIHQTFNLVPSLLDQLEEYLPPASRSDTFLDLSRKPASDLTVEERRFVLWWFFLAHIERMIQPYPCYHDLLAKRGLHPSSDDWPSLERRFSTQEYRDLQVWFNLVWIDPWLRRQDPQLAKLEAQGSGFTEPQKQYVLDQHIQIMGKVIPAYRQALRRGQVELTTSPYYHPILPLLCEMNEAKQALPDTQLPRQGFRHPDDASWHLRQALTRHHAVFGSAPKGFWPSEGSVSEAVIGLAMAERLRWMATDEEILWRSLQSPRNPAHLYRPHVLQRREGELAIVFRDRELSDLIGFVYSQWDPKAATADFLKRLESIRIQVPADGPPALVSVILDGENAWEYYPDDGHEFFMRLYEALARDERFRCVTVSEFLDRAPMGQWPSLPKLSSGSWIGGNFATWVGHPEKNAAWAALSEAREALGPPPAAGQEPPREAWKSLGIAEGSDWMWWFGDTHFSAQADQFDALFRAHLMNAYRQAGLAPPEALEQPIRQKQVQRLVEPTGLIHPVIDGRETSYYEWLYAGRCDLTQQYAAIQRSEQCVRQLLYGFDDHALYLRIDVDRMALKRLVPWTITVSLGEDVAITLQPKDAVALAFLDRSTAAEPKPLSCAFDHVIELALPLDDLPTRAAERVLVALALSHDSAVVERYPLQGTFALSISIQELEMRAWPL
ncbi:MAG: hypothetical protein HY737_06075 [Candidatus Omnitrophica bacterium]|nr:hypothetical protein [Candidatus Omnitrophota bacterium]